MSVAAVVGLVHKYSDRIFHSIFRKAIESINMEELSKDSRIYSIIEEHNRLIEESGKLKSTLSEQGDTLNNIITKVDDLVTNLRSMQINEFRSDLRSRLEYCIQCKGKVDDIYWDHISMDFNHYINDLHLNSYIKALFTEAEKLYIDRNIKHEI
jgi:hypothetical protein